MLIENTSNLPIKQVGRPNIYPFDQLLPGQKLTITRDLEDPDHNKKVASSLYHYKRNNSLKWVTAIRSNKKEIIVYRIS